MDRFVLESYRWKVGPTGDRQVTIDGVTIVVANLTRDVGYRRWNIGVDMGNRVEWVESGRTLAEVEGWIPQLVANELERRRMS